MLIIFGSGSGESVLGHQDTESLCESCGNSSQHTVKVFYRYAHIFYLMSFLTSRQYADVCPVCNSATSLNKADVKGKYKDTVPFIRKKGWMLCILLVAAFVAFALYSTAQQDERNAQIIAAPAISDLYFANLAKIPGSGYAPSDSPDNKEKNAYGAMRLIKIEGDTLYFAVATKAYSKKSGLRKIAKSKTESMVFDTKDPLILSLSDVQSLTRQDIIYEARR